MVLTRLVSAHNLGKTYTQTVWGIRGASFDFEAGRLIALIGPNGAGKTTLIHLVAGIAKPTEGTIQKTIMNGNVGWCSQHQTIDWFMNVRDNILLGARLSGIRGVKASRLVDDILGAVDLSDMADKQPDQLSGGQQQRVQVARALATNAPLLLLDEPTNGLDPKAALHLMDIVKERVRNGTTAVVSSHDMALIESHADDVMLLDKGRMLTFGSHRTFMEKYKAHMREGMTSLRDVYLSLFQKEILG